MGISVKTKEHIRRRLAAGAPKWGALAGGAAVLALTIAFTHSAVHIVTVTDTHGGSVRLVTTDTSVNALLRHTGMPLLGENDAAVWSETSDGEHLEVRRAYTVSVTADGETQQMITTGATTAELLAQAGIAYDEDDKLTPAADETVAEGENITVQRVEYREYTVEETIPATTEEVPTSLLYRSQDTTLTAREGSDGLDTVTYREVWVDGEWQSTEELARETQVGMVPNIVKVYGGGAAVSSFVGPEIADGVPSEGVIATYTGQRSTGYSASATAKGASGRRLTYGTVAVNPSIIPYGTLMYITSDDGRFVYGYAYAADTGTAMMEGTAFVDLYYETYDESVKNAVISVTVYVIDDEVAAQYKEQNDALLEADTEVGR